MGHLVQPPCRSRVTQSRLHRTLSRRGWNISREGDSTGGHSSSGVTLRAPPPAARSLPVAVTQRAPAAQMGVPGSPQPQKEPLPAAISELPLGLVAAVGTGAKHRRPRAASGQKQEETFAVILQKPQCGNSCKMQKWLLVSCFHPGSKETAAALAGPACEAEERTK